MLGSKEIAPANPAWGLESLILGRPATVSAPPPAQLDLYDLPANVKGLMKLELNGDVANGDLATLFPLKNLKSLVIKKCSGVSGDWVSAGKFILFSLPCLHLMPFRIADICLTVRLLFSCRPFHWLCRALAKRHARHARQRCSDSQGLWPL